jgi:UDP-N-acetylmuramate--alanine ligase
LKNIFDYIFTGRKLNYDLVKKYYFLLEACEYQRHFLTLDLDDAIITSLELEHTDYFKDWNDYQSAFLELIEKLKGRVYVLPNLNSEQILQHPKTVIIQPQHFDFQHIRGEHQQQNASLVYGLLDELTNKQQEQEIKKQIEQFHGIRRRMEELTTTERGVKIFTDYGHMASSLEGGLRALREKFPEKKIICIFQPHQMHRILQGWNDFPKALA